MGGATDHKGEPEHDVVLVHGRTEDGEGLRALRSRPGRVDLAEIRPVHDGQPLGTGELVRLRKREGSPVLWDVDVQYAATEEPPAKAPRRDGPARVATDDYRRNWDAIFGAGAARRRGELPN